MKEKLSVVVLVLIVLALRLSLAGQTPYVFGDESYYHIRQVASLRAGESTEHVLSPLFDYVLTALTYLIPADALYKILPNILACSFIVIAYWVAKSITKDKHCAFTTASLAGFIPVFFSGTFNTLTVYSAVIPLLGLLVHFFLHLDKGVTGYIITLVLLSFLHPSVLVFALGLLVYALLTSIEEMPLSEREKEVILFSIIFVLWSQFVLYKAFFIGHSHDIIYQNIPRGILTSYFKDFNILDAIYRIDAVPFLFALYAMRQYLFKIANKDMYFLISMMLATGSIVWQKLMPLDVGLMFLGGIMVLVMAKAYQYRLQLIARSRLARHLPLIKVAFYVIFMFTAVASSMQLSLAALESSTIEDEHRALQWLKSETDPGSVVLSEVGDAQKIMALAHRRVVLHSDFLLIDLSDSVYDDVYVALTSPHVTQIGERLEKHAVDYVYLSTSARESLAIDHLPAANGCLPLLYNTTVRIYQWNCTLEIR